MGKTHRPMPFLRLVNRKNIFNLIVRKGASRFDWGDLYHWLLNLSWLQYLALVGLLYVASNTLFALIYLTGGNCIQNARPGSFVDAFFFSVQTMATIGYGGMAPANAYANTVVAIEALTGLLGVTMVTGLAFARFSLPTARVLFSKVAVIAPYNGVPTLMFRTANERRNLIVEAQLWVTLVRNEITTEGHFMRRLHDLQLVRSRTPIFALTWTIMHPIDETSPLYGITLEKLAEEDTEIVVTMTGFDETVAQMIHARHSFIARDILWNKQFVDIFSRAPNGQRTIDYTQFHDVLPI